MPIPHRKVIKTQLVDLLSSKGPMEVKEVYSEFATLWELTNNEMSIKRNGRALFENEIRWARQELAGEGIIEKPDIAGRSIWKLKESPVIFAEEYDEDNFNDLTEGAAKKIVVNAYERNKEARKKCLEFYGYQCVICNFDFEKTYGSVGKNCIHVHHLVEISSIGKKYIVDPIKDMAPVCPNCHFIIHQRKPAFTIDEIRAMLNSNKIKIE